MNKQFWQSKTVWIAVAQAVAGFFLVIHTQYPDVGWIIVGKSCLDVIIRFLTEVPLA